MRVDIREEPITSLDSYASVPIGFAVTTVLHVTMEHGGLGGISLRHRDVEAPYVKDYDALDGGPTRWRQRFDLSSWGLLAAFVDGCRVGGAAIAFGTRNAFILEDRSDLAVLWDMRVSPERRGSLVGTALLAAAEAWAAARNCRQLKVETQNVNVPACRFYAKHGFALGAINRFAYPSLPEEVQLLWYKVLRNDSSGRS